MDSVVTDDLLLGYKESGDYRFQGYLANVRYSSAALYVDGFAPTWPLTATPDTTALYVLDDGSGSTASDASDAGHDGAINGATWASLDCPDEASASSGDLVCIIDEASTDADGDVVSYTFEWDVDGDAYTDADTTTETGDTVLGDALGDDETWTCDVTPDDGEDDGEAGSASYYIEEDVLECCSFTFDNTSADMSVSTSGFGLGQADFTVEFWMHADDTVTSSGTIFRTKEENYQAMQITANLSSSDTILLDAMLFETPSTCVEPNNGWDISLPRDDEWHHVVFQRRGDNIESYLDGEFQLSVDMLWYGCGCGSSLTPCLSESTPGGFGFGSAPEGMSIGSFRFVRNARYSGSFTPATSWAVDGDTLAQWNTDDCFDGTSLPDSSDRDNDGYDPINISETEGLETCPDGPDESDYAWTLVGSDTVGMIYGSCAHVETSTATCDSSTAGEYIYINTSPTGSLQRKRIGETHLGLTGARGFSISISGDGKEASWQGATGCGGDYVQYDPVDIYRCVAE